MDRGGGRGCQLGPGLSSGSLFLPRVSLGAAGDNVALREAAGGGGTRRTERYPPGPTPRGPEGLGRPGGRAERGFPRNGVGASSYRPPSLCHPKVPRRTGGAQFGGCPNGRWPVPITGAFGVPASLAHLGESTPLPADPPRVVCGSGGTLVALLRSLCPTASLVFLPPAGSFVPGGFLLPFIPGGLGTPAGCAVPAGTAYSSGCRGQGLQRGASLPLRPTSSSPASGTGIFPFFSLSTFLQPAVTGGWRRGVQTTPGVRAIALGGCATPTPPPPRYPDAGDVL